MNPAEKIAKIRLYVLLAALIGLGLALIVTTARPGDMIDLGDFVFAAIIGSPFFLALLSLRLHRRGQQRWVWLVAAVLCAILAVPLMFSIGIFFLAIAVCFFWAFAMTGRNRSSSAN